MSVCEQPFWENPRVLYDSFNLDYNPKCENQTWNLVARILIISLISGLVSSIFFGSLSFVVSVVFALVLCLIIVLIGTYRETNQASRKRGDEGHLNDKLVIQLTPKFATEGFNNVPENSEQLETVPSARNPFMNVLVDEYGSNAKRPAASSVDDAVVKQTLDDYFRVQWFSDPTDVYGKNQGQRQFITQPSTSIPNDRESYQNWLYKIPGKTCKEGGRLLCMPGTDGSPVTRLNQRL